MTIPKNFVFMRNPPTKRKQTRRSKYDPIVEACRQHPGMWTIFNDSATCGIITFLKKQFPEFEFTTRLNDGQNNKTTVYGRFVGDVDLQKGLQLLDED